MAANKNVLMFTHPLVYAAGAGDLVEVKRLLTGSVDPDSRDEDAFTALHAASDSGHSEIVRELLQSGSNVNAVTSTGTTAFYLAAGGGHLSVLRCLQQAGAAPHAVNQNGHTALMYAAQGTGSLEVVRYLIDDLHLNIRTSDIRGFTVLHSAAHGGHVTVVEELLHRGADVHAANEEGATAFHRAAWHGHLSVLRCLQQAGADPHVVALDGHTALMYAAQGTGSLEVVRYLVDDLHVDIHTTDNMGYTVLHSAAQGGHVRVVEELMHRGADVHAVTEQRVTAFHLAAGRGHLSVLRFLQQARANPYAVTLFRSTALMYAGSGTGSLEVVKYLVDELHLDVHATNNRSFTALHIAAQQGHVEVINQISHHLQGACALGCIHQGCVTVLVDSMGGGPAPHAVNQNGHTALMYAAQGTGSLEVVRYLIDDLHLNIRTSDIRGFTVLHSAAHGGHVTVVEELLHRGADVHAANEEGATAFHRAAWHGHLSVLRCLQQAGADPHVVALDGHTALMYAAQGTGSLEVVRYLVDDLHVDIHTTDNMGYTVLHSAAQGGHVRVVEELMHRGADVHAVTEQRVTAFHLAAGRGHLSVLRFLQQARANPYAVTLFRSTALMYAGSGTGSLEVVKYLVDELHLDVHATNNRSFTALHIAAQQGHVRVVEALLHRGANVNCVNDNGNTAEMVAVTAGHTEIAAYLRLQLTHSDPVLNAVSTDVHSYIPSILDKYNPNTKASNKMKENQVHLVTSKALTSTSLGIIPTFGQAYINYPFYIADTSHRLNTASANQQQQYDETNETKNQTQNIPNSTISHDTKFMAQSNTSSTVVREESLSVESDTSIQPSTSAVYIHQKQTEEMDDSYLNVPTPAFLPMSPGGLDEIMVQSPATLDIINDVLQTEELTNITSNKSNEKDTPFTIQVQAPPLIQSQNPQPCLYKASTSKPGSSLFEPSISPIPQEIQIQQSVIPPSGKNVRLTMGQDIRTPIYYTEKHKDNDVNTLMMKLKEQAAKLKEKDELLDRQAGKLKGKGKTIAGKAQELASKKEKIKELEEDREHSKEELNKKEMKLKRKGKQILEYQHIENDMKDITDLKEKGLIAKDKRIAEMKKYYEEEAKKRKVAVEDGRTSNYNPDNPATTALGILPERSPMTHSYLSAILKKQSEGEGSTQGLYSRELDHRCTREDIEMIYSAMEYICILDCQSHTGGFTGTGFLLGIVNHPQSGQTFAAILTNNHIYQQFVNGTAYFNYYDTNAGRTNGIPLTKNNVLCDDTLDYAMFCVDNATLIQRFFTKVKLIDKVTPLFPPDKSVTLIGHPNGQPLQVDMFMEIQFQNNILNDPKILAAITALRQNRIIGSNVHFFENDCRLFYHCNSFHGASGSPCFRIGNGHFDLVSLHSGGIFLNNINPGTNDVSDYESGVLMHLIKNNINLKMVAAGMIWM